MYKVIALVLIILLLCSMSASAETPALPAEHTQSIGSIKKLTSYDDGLDLYSMEVFYDYDIDKLTPVGVYDDQALLQLALDQALPGIPVGIQAPNFGCTAFTLQASDGRVYMGRNYDFRTDASAMMCYCHPKNGYRSVCFSALSTLGFNDPFASDANLAACLAAPFLPLDGMNEKGVGIAVLTLSSEPTRQNTGKPVLATPILIRMVLDRAATTREAVELISRYDYLATSGRDYHYYITDTSGDGVVVEWDCEREDRPMVVTPLRTITNYIAMYADKVLPNQANGIYGRGLERRDAVERVIEAAGDATDVSTAWEAAIAASQLPKPEEITSNTQWTVIYDLTDLTHEFVLHRHWNDKLRFGTLR